MHLNQTFISNILDLYGEEGQSWINDLPTQVREISAKWNLRFLNVMPDLTYNFVGVVEMIPTGESAILKMAPENKYIISEVQWLQCFDKGVPKIYGYDDKHYAVLMERLEPGHSCRMLVKAGDDDGATRIICHAIRELQSHQQKKPEFTHLSELVRELTVLKNHLDKRILSKADSLFRELTTDRTYDVLLHGDLHHDNVLSSGSTWKVIDPHGYVGDPAFDVGAMMYNPHGSFPKDRPLSQTIERRLKILAEELPFDAQRLKAWAFCRTVLSVARSFEGHATLPKLDIDIASAIDQVKI